MSITTVTHSKCTLDLPAILGKQAYQTLLTIGQKREFKKGELLCQAGELANHVYVLLSGHSKIYHLGENGKEVLLWFCFAGETFGLCQAFQGIRRTTYAQACSNCDVVIISREQFRGYLQQYPDAALHVIDVLSRRLHNMEQRMQRLIALEVDERLLLLLTSLSERFGVNDQNGIRIDLRITHQDMADMIGTSRQSVTTSLNTLKQQGMILIERRNVWLQPKAMEFRQADCTATPAVM